MLYYINLSTFFTFTLCGASTHMCTPNISLSCVSRHCLFVGFKTSFPRPWTRLTSSTFSMRFFFFLYIIHRFLVYHLWTICHSHTLIYGNLVYLYPWEPCTASFFFGLVPLVALFVGPLVWVLWTCLCYYTFVWPLSTLNSSMFQMWKG